MYKVVFNFSKNGILRYISHLDLMRLFVRAMRRADFPLKITQGFNPHPKFSIKRALKLGLESQNEEATIFFTAYLSTDEFQVRLQRQLPDGVKILSAKVEEIGNN